MKDHFVHGRLARLQRSTLVAWSIPPGSTQRSMGAAHPALCLAAGVVAVAAIAGCVPAEEGPSPDEAFYIDPSSPQAICQDCTSSSSGGGTTTLPSCGMACTVNSDCGTSCKANGQETTCGAYGVCRSCAAACDASASCYTSCRNHGAVTTCGGYGSCKRYDVYCGYPVITRSTVSDNNESGTGGAIAYMYFGSARYPKTDTYPSFIGGNTYDPAIAWASNFRGPLQVTGESSRPQWEFFDSAPGGLSVSFGAAGTPYLYGKQCISVTAGYPAPILTAKQESVYEDDECWGPICNPDDHVGSFTVDRAACNAEVFNLGSSTGWTSTQSAGVTGDVSLVTYKLWCYSCKNVDSPYCSTGVQ